MPEESYEIFGTDNFKGREALKEASVEYIYQQFSFNAS